MNKMAKQTLYKGIIERIRNKAFYTRLLELMKEDSSICYVTCDGVPEKTLLRQAMDEFPDRIIDVGIAEQNLVGVAAGLALAGKKPFAVTMSSFLTLRACEQIHTDVAFNNAPVRLIGENAGTAGGSGPTHDSICDLALLNAIPNMTIIVPSDMNLFWQAVNETISMPRPIYFRMPRFEDNEVYTDEVPFTLGGANIVNEGSDITIIATGKCVYYAVQAAKKLAEKNISIRVVDMYSIKPLNREVIIQAAKETKAIFTVEDHNIQGGLGTLVSAVVAEEQLICKIVKLGIRDEFASFGPRDDISAYYGFDEKGIIANILKNFQK